MWDVRTAHGVDHFIAISKFISRRIQKVYSRESFIIYPSVDTLKFSSVSELRAEFYVTCSRMVPYKKIDLIVETFTARFPEKQLFVIGDGPDCEKIKRIAGDNIRFLGRADSGTLVRYLSEAKAFVFAAEEDFGIAPLEAQSCGTPVIAYGKGGAIETIVGLDNPKPSGVFFEEQTVDSLASAVKVFESNSIAITSKNCRENALRFSDARFQKEFKEFMRLKVKLFQEKL
jgi:glycosyltransferase involved in cell wall biosynthesis